MGTDYEFNVCVRVCAMHTGGILHNGECELDICMQPLVQHTQSLIK